MNLNSHFKIRHESCLLAILLNILPLILILLLSIGHNSTPAQKRTHDDTFITTKTQEIMSYSNAYNSRITLYIQQTTFQSSKL